MIIRGQEKVFDMDKWPGIKEHDGKLFKEGKCPHCEEEVYSEITAWCMHHQAPIIADSAIHCIEDKRDMCYITPVRNAYECPDCNFIFDEKLIADFNNYDWMHCPVGEEYDPIDEARQAHEEMIIKEYKSQLHELTKHFDREEIKKLISKKYYLEAIGKTHIQLSRLLKFTLADKIQGIEAEFEMNYGKQVKGHTSYTDDEFAKLEDEREKRKNHIIDFLEKAHDSTLQRMAHVFGLIENGQYENLHQFNIIRNTYLHSFDKTEKLTEGYIKSQMLATFDIIEILTEKADMIIHTDTYQEFDY